LKSIESFAFHKSAERLTACPMKKQRMPGSSVMKASRYLIADEPGTSRVVISRLLKQLEK
jgi:CRP/FNR family transcriptional regulator, anaerobic regulatory protein